MKAEDFVRRIALLQPVKVTNVESIDSEGLILDSYIIKEREPRIYEGINNLLDLIYNYDVLYTHWLKYIALNHPMWVETNISYIYFAFCADSRVIIDLKDDNRIKLLFQYREEPYIVAADSDAFMEVLLVIAEMRAKELTCVPFDINNYIEQAIAASGTLASREFYQELLIA